jgi:hypothetical protein
VLSLYGTNGAALARVDASFNTIVGISHMNDSNIYIVHAQWDKSSGTWATNGEDIPGLICESDNLETLIEAVADVAPDLLHSNVGMPTGQVFDIIIIAERQVRCTAA